MNEWPVTISEKEIKLGKPIEINYALFGLSVLGLSIVLLGIYRLRKS